MANTKLEQIRSVLKEKIRNYNQTSSHDLTGEVITVGDGIALVKGLKMTFMNEVLEFENGVKGLAISLDEELIGLTILGDSNSINSGMKVKRTNKQLEVPVGDMMLGRIVNALGEAIDGDKEITSNKFLPVERPARGIMDRESVNEPMQTGILAIDSIIPIGKGQRELIIGDRQTGKTAVAIDTIINQKGKNVRCVYVSIGQKNSTTTYTVEKLREHGAMDYTTIVVANSSDEAAMQYIAPYSGVTIAEEWMEQGHDVLIVYDDLTKHASAYRTLSLLLRRPPGREAYPGDVFYLHSRLLERAAKLNKELGNGSITALPIIETQAGDISAYVPTNVISITDGQIFLMTDAFNSGQRPAVDSGLSVSRVGSAAQIKAMKQAASSLKLELAQFGELESFSQFGSDLDKTTLGILNHGRRIKEILKQKQYSPYDQIDQAIILYAVKKHIVDTIAIERLIDYKTSVIDFFKANKQAKEIRNSIAEQKEISKDIEPRLVNMLEQFTKIFNSYSARTDLANFTIDETALNKAVANANSKDSSKAKTATKTDKKYAKPVAKKPAAKPAAKPVMKTNHVSKPKPAVKKPTAIKASAKK